MKANAPCLGLALCGLLITACDSTPTGVAPPARSATTGISRGGADAPSAAALASSGMTKTPVAGTIVSLGQIPPERFIQTPSGMCHYFDSPAITQFTGDVAGSVIFDESIQARCGFGTLHASAPVHGDVSWNGRSGTISGQWTTNCTADASQPFGLSCGGTFNVRGSGGLEGVQFHFDWGPGWFPFPYSGTAFSQ